MLAFRAVAVLAVAASIGTGAWMAASTVHPPAALRVGFRRPQTIMAPTDSGAMEPLVTVIPPDAPPPDESAWPPPLLNPEARLRMAWDLSLGRPNSHEILFSFDDGPNPGTTDRLLTTLDHHHVHAVFFVCGWRMEADEPLRTRTRNILMDIAARGHVIGNHTVHHRLLPQLTPAQIAYEIDHNADLIEEVLHERPHLLRPPYGAYSEDVRRHVVSLHNELWLWSIDPHDYAHVNDVELVAQLVINNIGNHAGGTVLLHDTHPWSVAAVPKILQWIERENRDRAEHNRPLYEIVDARRYLAGARTRIPLIEAAQRATEPRTTRDAATDGSAVDAVVEPTTGAVSEATDASVSADARSAPAVDASVVRGD